MPFLVLNAVAVVALGGFSPDLEAHLASPVVAGALVGVYAETSRGEVLVDLQSDRRFVPASNQKVLTMLYAFERLGPDFRPRVRVWKEPDRLVVDAPGHPLLTSEELRDARRRLGVRPGTPVHARQAYRVEVPPSWEYDDLAHRYAAPVTAFTVDRSGFEVRAEGGKLSPLPPETLVTLRHEPGPGEPRVSYDRFSRRVIVRGSLPETARRLETFALPRPDQSAALFLGGPLVSVAAVPERSPDLVVEGPPLREWAALVLTESDNLVAENLLLMAAAAEGPLGERPYETARERISRFLHDEVGLAEGAVRVDDGSGLSRHNVVTPKALVGAHRWASTRPWGEDWKRALASPGRGTLGRRLEGVSVRGKTGTLDLVVTLSGILEGPGEADIAFAICVNHALATPVRVRDWIDDLVRLLASPRAFGPILAVSAGDYGPTPALPIDGPSAGDRLFGPRRDRVLLFPRLDRRAQPPHAALAREQRVVVRPRQGSHDRARMGGLSEALGSTPSLHRDRVPDRCGHLRARLDDLVSRREPRLKRLVAR